jgi:spore coat polysaccharide biosynthesis protein SpsF
MMLGIIQARVSSSRLPGKVLKPILGTPMLARQIERVKRAKSLDRLIVATSTDATDDAVAALAADAGVGCWRGSLTDVLDRFVGTARAHGARDVVRLTGDCPLADPDVIDDVTRTYRASGADYTSNVNPPTFPDGLDVEVMRMAALERAWREAQKPSEREHVTLYIRQNPDKFRLTNHAAPQDLSALRWTVDHPEDFAFVTEVYATLYPRRPDFRMHDILELLAQRPELCQGNMHLARNERLQTSLHKQQG